MTQNMDELRRDVALACRMLGATGLTTPLLGHVSVRIDEGQALVRCRGPQERGLLFTTVDDILPVPLDGPATLPPGWSAPHELPIHTQMLRARPDVTAVLHAHPRSALLAGLADAPIRPVFGAYDIPAYLLAKAGVPVFGDSGLVSTAAAGQALAAAMGESQVCLLRGHGVVTAGATVPTVIAHLLALDELLSVSVDLARLGAATAEVVSDRLPNLGPAFNVDALWRHHLGLLGLRGLADVRSTQEKNDDGGIR
jgi:ribulose-5-phosphate 4-epimerase/fuculose-1-phosphate aldolase